MIRTIDTRQTGEVTPDTRGVTEVLSVALLIGIVLTGAGVIVFVGGGAISDQQSNIGVLQAEHAMTQVDSQASQVAFQGADSQEVDMGVRAGDGTLDVDEDAGWIRVGHTDYSTGEYTEIANESLGAMVYEDSETTVAYQGGGVWRSDGEGAVMISRPEFHYRDDTLSVPVIQTTRGGSVHSEVMLTRADHGVQHFPNESTGLDPELEDSTVTITVRSAYYEAWGQYFEDESDTNVRINHEQETVTVTFHSGSPAYAFPNGIVSTAGHGNVSLHGTGAYISSYNSTSQEFDLRTGSVEAAGNVDMQGDSEIASNVSTGKAFTASGNPTVDGDVYWTEEFDNEGTITGSVEQIDGVASIPEITDHVRYEVAQIRQDNDNDNAPAVIQDNEIRNTGGTLEAGDYYLESMHVERDEELVLDTSDGNITLGVRDWVGVDRNGQITVEGDGKVHVFVAGEANEPKQISGAAGHVPAAEWNLYVDRGATVQTPDRNASQLTVYGTDSFTGGVGGPQDTEFNGVIYAPAGYDGSGYFYIAQAELYGAVVAGDLTLNQFGSIYFDHALESHPLVLDPIDPQLEHLYVTTYGIEITDD